MDVVLHEGYHGILTRHHHKKNNPRANYQPLGGGQDPDDDDDAYDSDEPKRNKAGSNVIKKIITAGIVIISLGCYVVWEIKQL